MPPKNNNDTKLQKEGTMKDLDVGNVDQTAELAVWGRTTSEEAMELE